MNDHRLLVLENKARADVGRAFTNESALRDAMEHRCLDVLELAAEVRRLNGRLEAVCDVVSNAAAFGDWPGPNMIMEAVRGESLGPFKLGDRVRMNRDMAGMKKGEEGIVIELDVSGTNLVRMDMLEYDGRYNMDPEFLDKVN